MSKSKIIVAKNWKDLPEILRPGEYYVDGERFVVETPVEKEFMKMAVSGVKEMHKRYYG
ncbi:MAG: hypothetical protein GSR72_06660 [Desulfurococcales archaeon]|nr:hypothetical protein [Desulfurococcales archaeon]